MANEKKQVTNPIYTRNTDPLNEGHFFSNINVYDAKEEELDLHTIKQAKLYVSIPTFKNSFFINECAKLDTILQDYENISSYVISNEPVFTQSRLLKGNALKKLQVISDFKNREFARATGTYIYELSSLVKAIFIVNSNDKLVYVKYFDDLYSNFDLNEIAKEIQSVLE